MTESNDGSSVSSDERVQRLVNRYALASAGTMFAIPVPGADLAASFGVWVRMIMEIAREYGYEPNLKDATALQAHLFRSVVLTTMAWFGSAATASSILKFVPFAGTLTAYAVDAAIAALGTKKVTALLGFSAAAYYKSGKSLKMPEIKESLRELSKDPNLVAALLRGVRAAKSIRK